MSTRLLYTFLSQFDEPHEKFFWNFALLFLFSVINYLVLVKYENQDLTVDQVIYFTVITHFTVGYGDISPKTALGRAVTVIHVILAWFITFVPAIKFPDNVEMVLNETVKGGKRFSIVQTPNFPMPGPAFKYQPGTVAPELPLNTLP